MSHWAEIDKQNKVIRVLVGDNNLPDEGEAFMNSLGGTWIKTSYNGNIRGVFAGKDFTYNEAEDIFVYPQPYPSWTRSGSYWNAPIPKPEDGNFYQWNEATLSWDVIDEAPSE